MWKTKEIQSFGTPENHGFKITSIIENNNYFCTVAPGTVNGIMPSNILQGTPLTKFPISKDSIKYVVLKANTDTKTIVSATIEIRGNSAVPQTPTPFGLPSNFEVLIGMTYGGQVYQVVRNSLNFGAITVYIESKAATEPGTLPYTAYFIWG